MPQAVPRDLHGDVYSVVANGLDDTGKLLADYHATTADLVAGKDVADHLGRLQDRIDAVDGWSLANEVDRTLTRLGLNADTQVAPLSGGMKRRVLLARALVANPDILLLDEPTNHLDIGAVSELEETIASLSCAVLLVTHDRAFLDRVATRIIEIDRGRVSEWPGDYARYRELKREALEAEATAFAEADKELAREEVWIRQGIKARRTRNEGRVRALEKLREVRKSRRDAQGTARLTANIANKSGKRVLEAEAIGFEADGKTIVAPLDLLVQRGDRIGLIGPNGCGKSTLVKLLLGELTPTHGSVKEGTELQVAYLDQHRDVLDPRKSAADNVSGGRDMVTLNGGERHIMSYLQDFLFQPARARGPITALSGGELGRLVLARLFAKPSNVLILDEPSNDLDIETLELLEHMIGEYPGTVILISHDRALLENSVTRSLVYQGQGRFIEVAGGWEDFTRERQSNPTLNDPFTDLPASSTESDSKRQQGTSKSAATQPLATGNKLSYKLARELEQLPEDIAKCESEQAEINDAINADGFFDNEKVSAATLEKSKLVQAELERLYARWDELESLAGGN